MAVVRPARMAPLPLMSCAIVQIPPTMAVTLPLKSPQAVLRTSSAKQGGVGVGVGVGSVLVGVVVEGVEVVELAEKENGSSKQTVCGPGVPSKNLTEPGQISAP